MYELNFRTPVACQNGHKALWYWSIRGQGLHPGGEIHRGVVTPCKCPKHAPGEGYIRNGADELFTGCKDKTTGIDIYEGDIVTTLWHWEEPHVMKLPDDFYSLSEYALSDELTLVGNIHGLPI